MSTNQPDAKKKHMWVALLPLLALGFAFMPKGDPSALTRTMGIQQRLGDKVPTNLPFTDENGNKVVLGGMFQGRPVVIVPIFYSCKTGCAILTDNIIKTLAQATKGNILKPGRDLDIVMYSIDPVEDANLAHAKKALIFNSLTPHLPNPSDTAIWRGEAEKGWHLLTGSKASVAALSASIGFKYSYKTVPDLSHRTTMNLINHPTCTAIATPQGVLSSYTIGNEFQTKEIQSDLLVAGRGEVGRAADQSWMFGCLMVDPTTGRNRIIIENVWRVAGLLTLIVIAFSVGSMFLKNHRENLQNGGSLSPR